MLSEEKAQIDRLQNISSQFKKFRNSAEASKLRAAFKALEGLSPSEIVKKFESLYREEDVLKTYKSEVNKILTLSKNKELSELEKLLDSLNREYKSKLAQLKEAEEQVKKIKNKSSDEISRDIQSLDTLYQLIESGAEHNNLDVSQNHLWEEIHSKVDCQMRQERELWEKKSNLKATSRNAAGVKGIDLSETDEIVSVSSTYSGENMVLIIDENGRGKCTSLSEYRMSKWNSKGILSCKKAKEEEIEEVNSRSFKNLVAGILINYEKDSLILWTEKGFLKRFKARELVSMRKNRITSGNKLIELEKGDKIKKFAKWKNVEEGSKSIPIRES